MNKLSNVWNFTNYGIGYVDNVSVNIKKFILLLDHKIEVCKEKYIDLLDNRQVRLGLEPISDHKSRLSLEMLGFYVYLDITQEVLDSEMSDEHIGYMVKLIMNEVHDKIESVRLKKKR